MLEAKITLRGRSMADIEDALGEVRKAMIDGENVMGFNTADGALGSYHFERTGEDDYERLNEKGWDYDGEGFLRGRMTRPRSYDEALKEQFGAAHA